MIIFRILIYAQIEQIIVILDQYFKVMGVIMCNTAKVSDKEIAIRMGEISGEKITSDMIRQQRRKMQVIKKKGRPKPNLLLSRSLTFCTPMR